MSEAKCFAINQNSKQNNFQEKSFGQFFLPADFSITAHAGALGLPENTIFALLKAIDLGVDIVEMDVSFRPDGTPVMIHKDAPKQNEGVLLIEAFKAVKGVGEIKINLDLKSTNNISTVEELAEREGMLERVFYTGVNTSWVCVVVAQSKRIPFYLNSKTDKKQRESIEYAQTFANELKNMNCIGLNCNFSEISKTLVDVLHENGLLVSVWTVDKKTDMKKMLAMSVDNITTRKPNKLFDLINRRNDHLLPNKNIY